ncbi:uncharacterized protein CIMG_13251, partial [Coccidioides immitis RS]
MTHFLFLFFLLVLCPVSCAQMHCPPHPAGMMLCYPAVAPLSPCARGVAERPSDGPGWSALLVAPSCGVTLLALGTRQLEFLQPCHDGFHPVAQSATLSSRLVFAICLLLFFFAFLFVFMISLISHSGS